MKGTKSGFLSELSAPAERALLLEGITTVKKLSRYTKSEVRALHGLGPSSLPVLEKALSEQGLRFKAGEGKTGNVPEKKHRIYTMSFARVYSSYIAKAERKGRTKAEVDELLRWLTGYSQKELGTLIEKGVDVEAFFKKAPRLNPARKLITGVVCGVRVEEVKEPLMREIRYLDKLVDELAKGRAMEDVLRE